MQFVLRYAELDPAQLGTGGTPAYQACANLEKSIAPAANPTHAPHTNPTHLPTFVLLQKLPLPRSMPDQASKEQGPEVLKRHPIGFRVDLYGFGVMIWEMYTSKLPWSDCTLEQMTHKVAIANERPPGMPPAFAHVREYCC